MEIIRYDPADEARKAFMVGTTLSADLIGVITSIIPYPPKLSITIIRADRSKQCAICLQTNGFNENLVSILDISSWFDQLTKIRFYTCDSCRSGLDPSMVFCIPSNQRLYQSNPKVLFIMPYPIIRSIDVKAPPALFQRRYNILPYVQITLRRWLTIEEMILEADVFLADVKGRNEFNVFESVRSIPTKERDVMVERISTHVKRLMSLNRWPKN